MHVNNTVVVSCKITLEYMIEQNKESHTQSVGCDVLFITLLAPFDWHFFLFYWLHNWTCGLKHCYNANVSFFQAFMRKMYAGMSGKSWFERAPDCGSARVARTAEWTREEWYVVHESRFKLIITFIPWFISSLVFHSTVSRVRFQTLSTLEEDNTALCSRRSSL